MVQYIRTNSGNNDFQKLVTELDEDLAIRDGADHAFYAQFNKTAAIKQVIVAYNNDLPAGCGAIREYSPGTMEVKRMYVPPAFRGKGIASRILKHLEDWCAELNYTKCILETGKNQPEAIALYKKNGYSIIPNYGQYKNIGNSVCFEKELLLPEK
ncbi:GNAT family N-acetyltransferase [Flavihumibacter profundi]|jgi:putative acetyltransferase|uniref:GNAT family N-acetyltransferase n=1 Tax=Flavihumibacter profundi TaxID=2716883 RepID=UPI001CC5A377|nr:GNAT family N-acetyltransferase [Flavihumibacter profundi]MBZ5855559.1 GNAT family N-acetyltransferase [Flavihumibacter profundi]